MEHYQKEYMYTHNAPPLDSSGTGSCTVRIHPSREPASSLSQSIKQQLHKRYPLIILTDRMPLDVDVFNGSYLVTKQNAAAINGEPIDIGVAFKQNPVQRAGWYSVLLAHANPHFIGTPPYAEAATRCRQEGIQDILLLLDYKETPQRFTLRGNTAHPQIYHALSSRALGAPGNTLLGLVEELSRQVP